MNFQKQNWLNKLSNLCKNSSNVCTLYNVHYCLFVSIYVTLLLCIEHTLSIVIIVAYVNNKINTTDLLSVQGDKKIFKKNIHNVYLKQLIFIFPSFSKHIFFGKSCTYVGVEINVSSDRKNFNTTVPYFKRYHDFMLRTVLESVKWIKTVKMFRRSQFHTSFMDCMRCFGRRGTRRIKKIWKKDMRKERFFLWSGLEYKRSLKFLRKKILCHNPSLKNAFAQLIV